MADSAYISEVALQGWEAAKGPRHSFLVRVTHWTFTISFLGLVVSGVGIILAHPHFYRGETPTPYGAPLRLRVARQLGYKSVKYLSRITVTDSLKNIGNGKGSISPDYGYSWYAGI